MDARGKTHRKLPSFPAMKLTFIRAKKTKLESPQDPAGDEGPFVGDLSCLIQCGSLTDTGNNGMASARSLYLVDLSTVIVARHHRAGGRC